MRHGQTYWLSDPKGYWYLCFKDVVGRSYLDRHIELIKGQSVKGESTLLKNRTIYHHVDEARKLWGKAQQRGLEVHVIPVVRVVSPLPL